ncbi:hypothetical protein PQQ99_38065, partial [Paraburkholderia sediminicola]|uniref:hypothetical protein n=1 Tax=Paraburkholderia sediminicola TaxID=458836 RepID=UPI0038BC08F3
MTKAASYQDGSAWAAGFDLYGFGLPVRRFFVCLSACLWFGRFLDLFGCAVLSCLFAYGVGLFLVWSLGISLIWFFGLSLNCYWFIN